MTDSKITDVNVIPFPVSTGNKIGMCNYNNTLNLIGYWENGIVQVDVVSKEEYEKLFDNGEVNYTLQLAANFTCEYYISNNSEGAWECQSHYSIEYVIVAYLLVFTLVLFAIYNWLGIITLIFQLVIYQLSNQQFYRMVQASFITSGGIPNFLMEYHSSLPATTVFPTEEEMILAESILQVFIQKTTLEKQNV